MCLCCGIVQMLFVQFRHLVQFCDFNDDPILVCNAISQLESVEESYESFGEYWCSFVLVDC